MIAIWKPLMLPKGFMNSRNLNDYGLNPNETFVANMIKASKGEEKVIRGKDGNEPDIKVGEEWIEITFAEVEAQKELKIKDSFTKKRSLSKVMEDIENAIERKVKKKYDVKSFSVATLVLDYAPSMYEDIGIELFDDLMFSYVDNFYKELYRKYIENKVLENVYIIFIDVNKSSIVVNIEAYFYDKDNQILRVESKELDDNTFPYREK